MEGKRREGGTIADFPSMTSRRSVLQSMQSMGKGQKYSLSLSSFLSGNLDDSRTKYPYVLRAKH